MCKELFKLIEESPSNIEFFVTISYAEVAEMVGWRRNHNLSNFIMHAINCIRFLLDTPTFCNNPTCLLIEQPFARCVVSFSEFLTPICFHENILALFTLVRILHQFNTVKFHE